MSIFFRGNILAIAVIATIAVFAGNLTAQTLDTEAKANLDAQATEALATLYSKIPGTETIADQASGILIFPKIAKGGLIVGGQYGEGVLRVGGGTIAYYNVAGASFGLQIGIQEFALVMMFLDEAALEEFKASSGWKAGLSASVALIQVGAQGAIDTTTVNRPVIAFPFSHKGMMAGITIQGAKFSRFP